MWGHPPEHGSPTRNCTPEGHQLSIASHRLLNPSHSMLECWLVCSSASPVQAATAVLVPKCSILTTVSHLGIPRPLALIILWPSSMMVSELCQDTWYKCPLCGWELCWPLLSPWCCVSYSVMQIQRALGECRGTIQARKTDKKMSSVSCTLDSKFLNTHKWGVF